MISTSSSSAQATLCLVWLHCVSPQILKGYQALLRVHGTIHSASNGKQTFFEMLHLTDPLFSKLGPRLKVVAIVDPAVDRAQAALEKKRDSFVVSAYQGTCTFKTFQGFIQQMTPKDRPHAVIIGSPPMFRGSIHVGRDIELQILKELPGVALFVEKPVATGPQEEIQDGFQIAKAISDAKAICSVG